MERALLEGEHETEVEELRRDQDSIAALNNNVTQWFVVFTVGDGACLTGRRT